MRSWTFLCYFIGVDGWSGDGHRVIARIASEFLRKQGKTFVAEHLCRGDLDLVERSLIEVSGEADRLEWSKDLHFSHTPYRACAPFDMVRDCGSGKSRRCVVTGIGEYTMRASDLSLSSGERGEAIKLIVHLLGDIHHPLHVGFERDLGGNTIQLSSREKSLHDLWDYDLVNTRQRELGVFKDSEEEDAEPWILSEALINELGDKKSVQEYMLKVQPQHVSSEQSATALAALMASQTATEFTCTFAYQKEDGEWIESGDSLDAKYLSTRVEVAMHLMKLAGIRLAEMINMIAHQYYLNKKPPVVEISSPPTIPAESKNRFLALDFDFDPDQLLYDEPPVKEEEDERVGKLPIPISSVSLDDAPKKVTKSMKRRMRKARAKFLFEGVDLDAVVLIKRKGFYVVTGSQLADTSPDYFPLHFDTFKLRFAKHTSEPVSFLFDMAHFGKRVYSNELIARALMRIKNLPIAPGEKLPVAAVHEDQEEDGEDDDLMFPSLSFKRVSSGYAPLSGEIKLDPKKVVFASQGEAYARHAAAFMFGDPEDAKKAKRKADKLRKKKNKQWKNAVGYVPSKEQLWEFEIRKNFNDICFVHVGRILFFVHKETLQDPSAPMIKANHFNIIQANPMIHTQLSLVVDNRIVDGELTDNMDELFSQAQKANAQACEAIKKKRPTLLEEISDIDILMHEKGQDRNHLLKRIKYLKVFPGDAGETYFRLHWSVHQEVPPLVTDSSLGAS
jgi:hypothetical protein